MLVGQNKNYDTVFGTMILMSKYFLVRIVDQLILSSLKIEMVSLDLIS